MRDQQMPGQSSRRSFLIELAAAGVGGGLLAACARAGGTTVGTTAATAGAVAGGSAGATRIGLQLYTVRDLLAQDFEGTLARVAQVGYRAVEFAGYYDRTPEQVRSLLDRLSLTAPSSHIGVDLLRRDAGAQIALARTIGHEYVTVPSYPFPRTGATADDWKRAAAEFNQWGAACRAQGLRLAYHNHDFEFQPTAGGPTGYDVLVKETDPGLVDFELDLYWATRAGRDPLQLFQQYPGRFAMWHVKDMQDPQGTKAMAPVGKGTIDFRAIFARAQQSGMRHFFVEHDNAATTGGSLPSIETSFQTLRQLLA